MSYTEIETTLAICSESPDLVVKDVAEQARVDRFLLSPRPDLAIRDVYLELPDRGLRSHGFGLRLRDVNEDRLVTLKGRPEELAGGGLRREEIELAWSREAMDVVLARLSNLGLKLTPPDSAFDWSDPHAIVSRMDFVVDQMRTTTRRPRDVSSDGDPDKTLAELVIDSVDFHLEAGTVRHHEIEVEAMGGGTIDDIQAVSSALMKRWPDALRAWHFGKRATGRAVGSILEGRGPSGMVSSSGELLPSAYDLILARLQ